MHLQDVLKNARAGRSGERPRRRVRLDLVVAWGVLLGPALALLGWGIARQRVGDLEERLVRDAHAYWTTAPARASHVDALIPGSIGDALAPHLPALDAEAKAARDADAVGALRAVVVGEVPLSALPTRDAVALARLGPALDGVLAASRAERADFSGADPFAPAEAAAGFLGLQHAALLAGARIRLGVAAGEPEAALRDCLDALALGRDAAIWGAPLGHMVGASIVERLAPACAAVLEALPHTRLADAARRLRTIRDAFPPFSATLRVDAVPTQLFAGEALPAGLRERLPARARRIYDDGVKDPAWYQVLVLRDGWRSMRGALDALIAAADLPDAEREEALDAVRADLDRRLNVVPAIALPLASYAKWARRADDARRRLDALAVAAAALAFRSERGRWPESAAEADRDGLLAPGAAKELRLERTPAARPLTVSVALLARERAAADDGEETEPERFSVAVRPPSGGGAGPRSAPRRAARPR